MKPHLFFILFSVAFTSLFILQGIWLYYAYKGTEIEIENLLNKAILSSAEQEMRIRFISLDDSRSGEIDDIEEFSNAFEIEFDLTEEMFLQQYSFMQEILSSERIPFNLSIADSIFSSYLVEKKLPLQYQLLYTDSLNNIIETSDTVIINGFRTDKIPIIDGFNLEAIVKIPPPVILKNMLKILLISIFIFVFIIACLLYEMKVYLTQHNLNQLRENFTHALTHNMKTPLGTVFTILDQIKKGAIDTDPKMKNQFLQIGIEQILNLQAIVNQILIVAYIEKKQLSLNKVRIDLPEIIKSLIQKFMVKGGKEILFTENYDLNDTPVIADQLYLSNTISNLIDNAIKYSEHSVKINITCTASNKQIYIRVNDNGLGISAKDQQKIFEKFERGAEFKRNKTSGFGLGLNYVKTVIEAHGGAIAIHSQIGKGSEFIITIPVVDDQNNKIK